MHRNTNRYYDKNHFIYIINDAVSLNNNIYNPFDFYVFNLVRLFLFSVSCNNRL